jgi:hypothetical protein
MVCPSALLHQVHVLTHRASEQAALLEREQQGGQATQKTDKIACMLAGTTSLLRHTESELLRMDHTHGACVTVSPSTELVVTLLQRMDVLPMDVLPASLPSGPSGTSRSSTGSTRCEFLPRDFADDHPLPVLQGTKLASAAFILQNGQPRPRYVTLDY